ncbi:nad dependent epimerase [Colletotrichum sojae]|uniref:Nad dependent epimerase n=1 Tax=Colletotrichum sojae TaxID=2175907 RepID=A0A8H6MYU4_9PEZI|nr:nad dependent epimerase [Colletotrichum sojae]
MAIVWDDSASKRFRCLNSATVFGPHLETIDNLEGIASTLKIFWQLVDTEDVPPLLWAGAVNTAADTAREVLSEEARRMIPLGIPGTGKDRSLAELYQVDGSKAVGILGVQYRPVAETVLDTMEQFSAVGKEGRA